MAMWRSREELRRLPLYYDSEKPHATRNSTSFNESTLFQMDTKDREHSELDAINL